MSHSRDPSEYCTLGTCPLSEANFTDVPNLAGNLLYIALFGVMLLSQMIMGIRWKTWGYLVGMIGGLALEIIGYAGRIQLHYNPFPFDPFLEYLICLTIGPAFLSASIYICLGQIVIIYGESISRLRPRTYTIVFVTCDLLALILQAVGGALTATADRDQPDLAQNGINIMIAGLSSQVASLFVFVVLFADFARRVHKNQGALKMDCSLRELRSSRKWKLFLYGLATATITIFIRCIYRVAELKGGFDSELANNEIAFMILEGAMIVIACMCMTAFHPGYCFGGKWQEAESKAKNKHDSELTYKETPLKNMGSGSGGG